MSAAFMELIDEKIAVSTRRIQFVFVFFIVPSDANTSKGRCGCFFLIQPRKTPKQRF